LQNLNGKAEVICKNIHQKQTQNFRNISHKIKNGRKTKMLLCLQKNTFIKIEFFLVHLLPLVQLEVKCFPKSNLTQSVTYSSRGILNFNNWFIFS